MVCSGVSLLTTNRTQTRKHTRTHTHPHKSKSYRWLGHSHLGSGHLGSVTAHEEVHGLLGCELADRRQHTKRVARQQNDVFRMAALARDLKKNKKTKKHYIRLDESKSGYLYVCLYGTCVFGGDLRRVPIEVSV